MAGFGFGNVGLVGSLRVVSSTGGSRYVTLNSAAILLPILPVSARTIAMYVRVPPAWDGAYALDNRDRGTGMGAGYLITGAQEGVSIYAGATQDGGQLPLLRSGAWVRVFMEYTTFAAPTIFARFSWNSGGASGMNAAPIDIAELIVYDRVLTSGEKSAASFPAAGHLLRYDFQNVDTTTTSTTSAIVYPLPDVSGNGYNGQLGVLQNGSVIETI